jgi:hypothetical protein
MLIRWWCSLIPTRCDDISDATRQSVAILLNGEREGALSADVLDQFRNRYARYLPRSVPEPSAFLSHRHARGTAYR